MEIKSLAHISFETIFKAFNQAFANYEVQLDFEQLKAMWKRRGFQPEFSFAAFEEREIVAFTLNGIGLYNGTRTAYDTGTGTLEEYRGQGLATKIFEYSIPFLKKRGIQQYLLEVLQHNAKAVSVYRALGFETVREFNYFMQENGEIRNIRCADSRYGIRKIHIEHYRSISDFWDFTPSWQNSMESIKRAAADLVSLGVFDGKKLIGYSVFEPASGDITQIAIDKSNRRKGIASLLLEGMLHLNGNAMIKVVNTDIHCGSITGFLQSRNVEIKGRQFEMVKQL